MPAITAADVKRLRDATGAGMMDCKKALTEADGDFDAAVEVLRVKGAAKAAARGAERTAADGLVAIDGNAMLELNCETDFVAKNEQFQQLAAELVADARANAPADAQAFLAGSIDGKPIADLLVEKSAVIGEKVALGRVVVFDGKTTSYLHRRSSDLPAQVGVLVEYTGDDDAAAHGAAMQVAAMRPQYLSRDEVPADVVAKEREIAKSRAIEEGKPERAIDKIVEGRVNAYFKDTVLVDQPSVQDSKKSVGAILADAGVTLTRFARFEVGQG